MDTPTVEPQGIEMMTLFWGSDAGMDAETLFDDTHVIRGPRTTAKAATRRRPKSAVWGNLSKVVCSVIYFMRHHVFICRFVDMCIPVFTFINVLGYVGLVAVSAGLNSIGDGLLAPSSSDESVKQLVAAVKDQQVAARAQTESINALISALKQANSSC